MAERIVVGEFEVETILAKRKIGRNVEYLVRWKNSDGEETWEPTRNLINAQDAVKTFLKEEKQKDQQPAKPAKSPKPKHRATTPKPTKRKLRATATKDKAAEPVKDNKKTKTVAVVSTPGKQTTTTRTTTVITTNRTAKTSTPTRRLLTRRFESSDFSGEDDDDVDHISALTSRLSPIRADTAAANSYTALRGANISSSSSSSSCGVAEWSLCSVRGRADFVFFLGCFLLIGATLFYDNLKSLL